jgi:hypothetical protein
MWFRNDGTEFLVGSIFDVEELLNSAYEDFKESTLEVRWLMVCCPIQPSYVTREQTNKYWESIKSNQRPEPEYPRFIDYIKVQALPSLDDHIEGLARPFALAPIGLQFQPQYRVLRTMRTSADLSFDRWVAKNLVAKQISFQVFCEVFQFLESGVLLD